MRVEEDEDGVYLELVVGIFGGVCILNFGNLWWTKKDQSDGVIFAIGAKHKAMRHAMRKIKAAPDQCSGWC